MPAPVLYFSDIHLHPFKQFAKNEKGGVNSRLLDGFDILRQIGDVAVKHKVSDVVFCGDLFHVRNNINISTFNLVVQEVIKLANKVGFVGADLTLIAGNHDQGNRTGDVTSLDVFRSLKTSHDNLLVITEPQSLILNNGQECTVIPYCEDVEKVTRLVKDSPFTDRLIAHLGLDGCDLGADFVYKNEGDWNLEKLHADRFDMGFFGHFHKHQKIRDNFYYVGAPMHHNFGDSGQPRGCLLDRGGKLSFIELDFPRFANCEHNDLPTINSRDFYRLNVDENIDTTKYELDNVDIVRVKKEQNAVSKPMTFMEAIESYIAEIDDASIDKAVLFKYVNTFIE